MGASEAARGRWAGGGGAVAAKVAALSGLSVAIRPSAPKTASAGALTPARPGYSFAKSEGAASTVPNETDEGLAEDSAAAAPSIAR
eukprot:scaffold15100_cov27-Tisochrysis_lutea.AAC.2